MRTTKAKLSKNGTGSKTSCSVKTSRRSTKRSRKKKVSCRLNRTARKITSSLAQELIPTSVRDEPRVNELLLSYIRSERIRVGLVVDPENWKYWITINSSDKSYIEAEHNHTPDHGCMVDTPPFITLDEVEEPELDYIENTEDYPFR